VFHPSYEGHYQDLLELCFFDQGRNTAFVISRVVEATVGSREDHEQLKAKEPYTRRKFTKFNPEGNIIPSLRPPSWTKTIWVDRLPIFTPPPALLHAAYGDGGNNPLPRVKRFMPPTFNEKTYAWFFQNLLYLEEERVK